MSSASLCPRLQRTAGHDGITHQKQWCPPTRANSGKVNARRPDPGLLEQALTFQGKALAPGFLPSRGEVLNAIPTAEHLKGSYGTGFTCGPPPHNRQPIGHVKVLPERATTWVACQAGS